jgi:hypothetical protein
MRPKKHLEYYSKVYPSAWKHVDKFRAGRGIELPFWPEWCFMPLAGSYAIVSAEAEAQGINIYSSQGMALINDVGIIGALAAWRVTQGIYRFDTDLYQAVISTPLTGDLPHEVLFNMPEWCVYIETPGFTFLEQKIAGYFAYLEYDVNAMRKELRLVLDHIVPDGSIPYLQSLVIHLGPWSLKQSLEKVLQEASKQSGNLNIILNFKEINKNKAVEVVQDDYVPLVLLLLYICSTNSDIGDGAKRPVKPNSKKTKKGNRMFPQNKIFTWDVGVRMGASLRKARLGGYSKTSESERQHASPRPHIRRAHWHHYWTGPLDGDRKLVVKWIPPIPVNVDGDENLPSVIRKVKKE